jgi:hypothetical protein
VSEPQITNGRRAARALDAINTYARMSSSEGLPESYFFFDFERGPEEQSGDHDHLSGLVCGLMHYAERRSLSFADALTDARRQYDRQRTNYAPEGGVQLADQTQRAADAGSAPLTGEIVTARPGDPPVYLVEFITSREWVPEPDLAPARPFPPIAASDGAEICSAYVARYCMVKAIRRIEAAGKNDRSPAPADAQDLDIFLTVLCGWSGLERPVVLRSVSTVLTEQDGQLLVAAPQGPHPVALAASGVASPPDTSLPADAVGTTAGLPRPAARQPHTGSRP